jgi:hypothetical protein
MRPREVHPEAPSGRLEDPDALGQDLLADAVAGNHRDAMSHVVSFTS